MREGGSGIGGMEGGLRKGTSKEGTLAWTERGKEGREEASGGWREGATQRGRGARKERGRKGDSEGWKRQGRYPEEDTVGPMQCIKQQHGPCHYDFGITNTKL